VNAAGALLVLQEDVDRAKLPAFFRNFALLESEAVSPSRTTHCWCRACCRPRSTSGRCPMVLLETDDRKRYAYVESQDIVSVVSDRDEVSELWLRHGMLRTQDLDTEESARIIQRVAGEL
jgi:hypothetical protein